MRRPACISWTPAARGSFDVTVRATNGVAPDATQTFAITVAADPSRAGAAVVERERRRLRLPDGAPDDRERRLCCCWRRSLSRVRAKFAFASVAGKK